MSLLAVDVDINCGVLCTVVLISFPKLLKFVIFRSGLVPLLSSISIDQKTGVVTPVCSRHVAIKLSEVLKPMKVIFLNDYGGLVDDRGKVCLLYSIYIVKCLTDNLHVSDRS